MPKLLRCRAWAWALVVLCIALAVAGCSSESASDAQKGQEYISYVQAFKNGVFTKGEFYVKACPLAPDGLDLAKETMSNEQQGVTESTVLLLIYVELHAAECRALGLIGDE